MLPPQGAWVLSLGKEIRARKLSGVINKNGENIFLKIKETMSLCPCLACGHRVCCRRGEWDGWGRGTLLSEAVCGQLPASSTPCPPAQQCQKRGHKPDLFTIDDPAISTIKVILAYLLNFLKSTVSIVWRCGETDKNYGFPSWLSW